LNLDRQSFEFDLFLFQADLIFFQLHLVSINELTLLVEQAILSAQFMLMVRQELLTVFDFDLLDLDLANVVLSLLCLQLSFFFIKELARILNLTFLVLNLDLDKPVLGATLLILLLESLACDRHTFFGLALLKPEPLLILLQMRHHLLPLLPKTLNLLILRLLQLQKHVLSQLKFALLLCKFFLLELDLNDFIFDHLALFFS